MYDAPGITATIRLGKRGLVLLQFPALDRRRPLRFAPRGTIFAAGALRPLENSMPTRVWNVLALSLVLLLSGCGYNDLQRGDEQVKAAWSEVLNQYQRRADLV